MWPFLRWKRLFFFTKGFVCFLDLFIFLTYLLVYLFIYLLCALVCSCACALCVCNVCVAHACDLQRPKEDVRSSEVGDTGIYEPPSVDAGNQTLVLCKSSLSSTPQNFLTSFPDLVYF